MFHDLRHTFGTLAVEAWPLHDVQTYMGHPNIQTTMIYIRHQPKAAAADKRSRIVALGVLPSSFVKDEMKAPAQRGNQPASSLGSRL